MQHKKVAAQRAHLAEQRAHVLARGIEGREHRQGLRRVLLRDGLHELRRPPLTGKAERSVDALERHRAACRRGALVEQAHAVAHAAVGEAREQVHRVGLDLDMLLIGDEVEPRGDLLCPQALEREPLAAGEDRRRDLLQLGRGEDEQQMGRRLLDDLEQGVERRRREHVDLVDDIHTHFDRARRIDRVVAQHADRVHTVIRRRVDLQHVHAAALVDGPAGRAHAAGIAVVRIFTVDRLGQDLGAGGLARAARAGEQVRMAEPARLELRAQRVGHALLPDHIRKRLRPVFPVQRLIHPRSPPFCLVLYTIFTGKKRAGAKIACPHQATAKKPSPMRGSHWGALPFVGAGQTKQTSPQKDADQQIRSAPSIDSRYSTATSYKSDTHRIRRRVPRHT